MSISSKFTRRIHQTTTGIVAQTRHAATGSTVVIVVSSSCFFPYRHDSCHFFGCAELNASSAPSCMWSSRADECLFIACDLLDVCDPCRRCLEKAAAGAANTRYCATTRPGQCRFVACAEFNASSCGAAPFCLWSSRADECIFIACDLLNPLNMCSLFFDGTAADASIRRYCATAGDRCQFVACAELNSSSCGSAPSCAWSSRDEECIFIACDLLAPYTQCSTFIDYNAAADASMTRYCATATGVQCHFFACAELTASACGSVTSCTRSTRDEECIFIACDLLDPSTTCSTFLNTGGPADASMTRYCATASGDQCHFVACSLLNSTSCVLAPRCALSDSTGNRCVLLDLSLCNASGFHLCNDTGSCVYEGNDGKCSPAGASQCWGEGMDGDVNTCSSAWCHSCEGPQGSHVCTPKSVPCSQGCYQLNHSWCSASPYCTWLFTTATTGVCVSDNAYGAVSRSLRLYRPSTAALVSRATEWM